MSDNEVENEDTFLEKPEPATDTAEVTEALDAPATPESPDTAADSEPTDAPADPEPAAQKKTVPLSTCVIIAVVAALVFAIGGAMIGPRIMSGSHPSSSTISESELDESIATYTYNGKTYSASTREVLDAQGSLAQSKDSDGNYSVPSSSTVTSYVQSELMLKAADDKGITVSDEDVDAYAQSNLGSSDYSTIGSTYGIEGDTVKQILSDGLKSQKLYENVTDFTMEQPTEPTDPGKGKRDKKTKKFASYIIDLLGDEWDSDNDTWARTDGPYYEKLKKEKFNASGASYKQAKTAYEVASDQYSTGSQNAQTAWSDFTSDLYAQCTLTIYGVYA